MPYLWACISPLSFGGKDKGVTGLSPARLKDIWYGSNILSTLLSEVMSVTLADAEVIIKDEQNVLSTLLLPSPLH